MFCPKCGNQALSGAAFCAKCGQRLSVEGNAIVAPSDSRKPLIWGGLIALLLLLLALLALFLMRPQEEILAQPAPRQRPVMRQTAPAPVQMPQEVYDWLEHVRLIEEDKQKLLADQKAKAMSFMTKLSALGSLAGAVQEDGSVDVDNIQSPAQMAQEKIEDFRPAWKTLIEDFESFYPPEECRPVFDAYSAALSEIAGQAGDVSDVLRDLSGNTEDALAKLFAMQGQGSTAIDDNLDDADKQVGAICGKYKTDKWFRIQSDRGGGAIFGQLGGGMMR